jgi:hypothetical protein
LEKTAKKDSTERPTVQQQQQQSTTTTTTTTKDLHRPRQAFNAPLSIASHQQAAIEPPLSITRRRATIVDYKMQWNQTKRA